VAVRREGKGKSAFKEGRNGIATRVYSFTKARNPSPIYRLSMRELLVDLYPRVARSNIIEDRAHLGKPIGIFVKHNVTLVFNELRKGLFILFFKQGP
jgi:hypothetical protein